MALPPLPERDELDVFQKVAKGTLGAIPFVGGVASEVLDMMNPAPIEEKRDDWLRHLANAVEDRPTRQELAESYGLRPAPEGPLPPTGSIDTERRKAVISLFGAASEGLLDWPQKTDGHWIERPEVDKIRELLADTTTKLITLIGEPGSGKSALLARAACELRDRGAVFLAIKADLIPATVTSVEDLDSLWGLPESVSTLILKLASGGLVLILIDQLDALGELMDTKTERFAVVQSLVDRLWASPNVKIVISSRRFDAEYDVRLRSIFSRRGCEGVSLQLPPWAAIEPLLKDKGFQTTLWPDCVREVLRAPQHLNFFLAHWSADSSQPAFASYTALLDEIIVQRAGRHFSNAIDALYAIAEEIGEREELWIPTVRVEARFRTEIAQLQQAGLLLVRDSGRRIGFQHQTLFSFVRARSFVAQERSLHEFIERHQESLSIRPTLWSAINYLRDADPDKYAAEMSSILADTQVLAHVKLLLVSFLGSKGVAHPSAQESSWIMPLLRSDTLLRPHILKAIRGRSDWLQLIRGSLFAPELLCPEAADCMSSFIRDTLPIDRDLALTFIENSWVRRTDCDGAICHALFDLKEWDDRSFAILSPVLKRNRLEEFVVVHLAESIVTHRPDLAARLIKEQLDADLDRAKSAAVPVTPSESFEDGDFAAHIAQGNARAPFKDLVHDQHAWYGVEAIAAAAPREFTETIWPWIVAISDLAAEESRPDVIRYRPDYAWGFGEPFCSHIATAIMQAVELFADRQPIEFIAFSKRARQAETMAIHRLLMCGLRKIASSNSTVVVEYLVEDPRRLAVSNSGYDLGDSEHLVQCVGPAVSDSDLDRLIAAIESWSFWIEPFDEERRASREEQNRLNRLNLFRALPAAKLPKQIAAALESSTPSRPSREGSVFGGVVQSPIAAAQFVKSTEEEILSALAEYPDSRERGASFLEGGSREVAREFAESTKSNPARSTMILRQLRPGDQTLAAGCALEEIAGIETHPAEDALELARDLAAKGFTATEEFRYSFARALQKIARRLKGLPDQDCNALKGLLRDASSPELQVSREEVAPPVTRNESVLWDSKGGVLPQGNYPILHTLAIALLLRRPPAADDFLAILETHLPRPEHPVVWQSLLPFLPHLAKADRLRAQEFVRQLLDKYPRIIETTDGVRFMASVHEWIEDDMVESFILRLKESSWPMASQALGEFIVLRVALAPRHHMATSVLESALSPTVGASLTSFRLGVAFSAAETWQNPRFRSVSHRVLMQMIGEGGAVSRASLRVLHKSDGEPFPNDSATAALLGAMASRPDLLRDHSASSILAILRELLEHGFAPVEAARLARAVLEASGKTVGDFRTAGPMLVKDLVALAFTFQRYSATKADGTWIFERLLLDSAYQINSYTIQLDRRF